MKFFNTYKKYIFLLIILLITLGRIIFLISQNLANGLKPSEQTSTNKKLCPNCNVLLIDIDLLRADSLPCYGYFRNTAPNICNMSKTSIIFEDNYSQFSWTLPSAISTITSLYPSVHQIKTTYIDILPVSPPTLAETFQKAGYQTVLAGGNENYSFLTPGNGGGRGYDLITDATLFEVINKVSQNPKPWFIHYYMGSLHMPYLLPENGVPIDNLEIPKKLPKTDLEFDQTLNVYLKKHYLKIFKPKTIANYAEIILSETKPNDTRLSQIFKKLLIDGKVPNEFIYAYWPPMYFAYSEAFDTTDPAVLAYAKMLYDTKIQFIDTSVGNFLKILIAKNQNKNTIKIIMSDHGEAFGEHGMVGHDSDHHSELFFTPLIMQIPGHTGASFSKPSSNLDIFPTLLEMVGINPVQGLQGISLIPFLNKPEDLNREFIFSENPNKEIILQNKDWLYYLPDKAVSIQDSVLYHKVTDPKETLNVAEKYPELTKKLYDQSNSISASFKKISDQNVKVDTAATLKLSPQKIEKIKKEGYF